MAELTDFEKNVLGATGYQDETGSIVSLAPAQDTAMDIPADTVPEEAPRKSLFGRIAKTTGNFLLGAAKGAGDTILSVPRNVSKVVENATQIGQKNKLNKLRDQITQQNNTLLETMKSFPVGDPRREKYKGLIQQNLDQLTQINADEQDIMDSVSKDASYIPGDKNGAARATVDDAMSAKNKAQQVGFRTEKIAELLVPAGATAKADKVISGMKVLNNTGKGAKFFNAGSRVLAKSGLEAGAAAASTLGQAGYQGRFDTEEGTEGALKEAKQNAMFAGGAKALFAGTGELLNAAKLPRKLASITYKTDKKDFAKMLENYGDDATKTVDDSGETLADWAVRNNLKGSAQKQAQQVVSKIEAAEKAVMETAEAAKVRISVDKGLKSFADDLAEEYAGYGRGEVTKNISSFIDDMADDGSVSVKEAIKFRRLIDKLRTSASFRNPRVGDNLKYWADDLRVAVNSIDGIGALNKDYAMSLRAADALMKKGISENNKQLIGALEMYTVGLPALAENPSLIGAGLVAGKRLVNSPRFQMGAGRTIKNLGNSSKTGIATRRILPEVVRDTTQPGEDALY